jgi:hypothetical protein
VRAAAWNWPPRPGSPFDQTTSPLAMATLEMHDPEQLAVLPLASSTYRRYGGKQKHAPAVMADSQSKNNAVLSRWRDRVNRQSGTYHSSGRATARTHVFAIRCNRTHRRSESREIFGPEKLPRGRKCCRDATTRCTVDHTSIRSDCGRCVLAHAFPVCTPVRFIIYPWHCATQGQIDSGVNRKRSLTTTCFVCTIHFDVPVAASTA